MWEVYDRLVSLVPEELQVEECLIGLPWTMIRSRCVGMAHTPFERDPALGPSGASVTAGIADRIAGMPVRKLAGFVKSWNPFEAALGSPRSTRRSIRRILRKSSSASPPLSNPTSAPSPIMLRV
jgi:uncharacterized protein